MRVYLDECIDWRFARALRGHQVETARSLGWTGLRNGVLLARAAAVFDVFITVDQNIQHQHDLQTFAVAVIVVRARTNRLADMLALAPDVLAALPNAPQGAVTLVASL
ncbi:MAG: DUF5615 family PIN-like protein [Alphaproteobacteria bacterium]|nr:DUF5615 family PIN-like protein [Alphaproteobacteria bacterium]